MAKTFRYRRSLGQGGGGRGLHVALLARSATKLETLAAELGEAALALPVDVADFGAMEAAIARTVERF